MQNNIWKLDKDDSVKTLLLMLQTKLGTDSFILLDSEDLNDKAIRIANPRSQAELSAYIYTYAQRKERYGLDLEFPYLIETRADDQTIRLNDQTAEEVLEKVTEHLEYQSN